MSSLKLENIEKSFGKKQILQHINIVVKTGEIVALFGPNGAGKTTCFDVMAGLTHPSSGNIFLDSHDITSVPIHLRVKYGISYLPQDSSILQELTVWENLIIALEASTNSKNNYITIAQQLLSRFSLLYLKNEKAQILSGGERRRLEIARALASKPKFLMLDEPLAGVDPISIKELKKIILQLRQDGIAIIITDHNIRDIIDIVDRAYIIYNGTVLIEGTAEEIKKSDIVKNVYLGDMFDEHYELK